MTAAFAGTKRLYIETAPFIYYVEEHATYVDKLEQIFDIVSTAKIEVITSVITLAEVLTKPLKTNDKIVENAYRSLLQQTRSIMLVPVTVPVAEQAANFRSRYNLRLPDAMHLAAAIDIRCDAFLTNDYLLKRVTELPILVLDDLELVEPPEAT